MAQSSLNPPLCKPTFDLSGRVFVITGGTQGLGLAIARTLKEQGASGLALVSRSVEKGTSACALLDDSNCRCIHIKADLGNASEACSVMATAAEQFKELAPISGVVNAAALTARGNLFTETADGFDRQMAVNVRAPFLITQAAAKHMVEHAVTNGSIVNIGSCAAYGGAPFVMAYSASKAALAAMTKTHATELASKQIRVNAINMGWCYTDNEDALQSARDGQQWIQAADAGVPLGRILRPEDTACTVAFLLSRASSMMTGSVLELHPEFPHGMISTVDDEEKGR